MFTSKTRECLKSGSHQMRIVSRWFYFHLWGNCSLSSRFHKKRITHFFRHCRTRKLALSTLHFDNNEMNRETSQLKTYFCSLFDRFWFGVKMMRSMFFSFCLAETWDPNEISMIDWNSIDLQHENHSIDSDEMREEDTDIVWLVTKESLLEIIVIKLFFNRWFNLHRRHSIVW